MFVHILTIIIIIIMMMIIENIFLFMSLNFYQIKFILLSTFCSSSFDHGA